jgi:hypothetical protein
MYESFWSAVETCDLNDESRVLSIDDNPLMDEVIDDSICSILEIFPSIDDIWEETPFKLDTMLDTEDDSELIEFTADCT